jgi:hypothetical protein
VTFYDDLLALIPNRKAAPNGWMTFNAVCCHHNGEKRDTKRRGGLRQNEKGGAIYHCFNCGFKTGWSPGHTLTKRMRDLLSWMGASDDQINRIALECMKTIGGETAESVIAIPEFIPKQLPKNSQKITEGLILREEKVLPVIEYIYSRGLTLDDSDFYWSNEGGYHDRMIIPMTYQHKLVGYIARKINDGKPKYITEHPTHIVFNLDKQTWDRKFVLVFEGAIDALLLGGVAVLTNEVSPEQVLQINALGKQVIVVPDKDKPGEKLIRHALNNNWSVAFPEWHSDIKDAADAVRKYGRLATLISIVKSAEHTPLKIELRMKL